MRRLAALLPVFALCACASLPGAQKPLGAEPVTRAYSAGGGSFDDGSTVIYLVRTFERDGRVAWCGVWTTSFLSGPTFPYYFDVAGASSLMLAGDRIAQNLVALPETPWSDDLSGRTAACYLSPAAWRPEYAGAEPEIRIPRMQWSDFDDGGSGYTVIFRQGPVPRPLPPMTEG